MVGTRRQEHILFGCTETGPECGKKTHMKAFRECESAGVFWSAGRAMLLCRCAVCFEVEDFRTSVNFIGF